jgi:adsorption protein B
MLKSTLQRFEHRDYRIFVGHYRNDPATAAAIASVADDRIEPCWSMWTGRPPRPIA